MTSPAKFSCAVWMITYNHEKYIEQAITSVLEQTTDFDFKLHIGVDNSSDHTREICFRFKASYPDKIELLLHDSNIGGKENAKQTFKACLESGAKYIAMLEGDDYWTDRLKLQKQIDLLELFPESSMSVALVKTVNADNYNEEIPERPFINNTLPLIYQNGLIKYFHTSTYVFKRTYLDIAFKKYNRLFINDTAICFLLINMGPFVILNEVVSVYRITDNGFWTGASQLHKEYQHYTLHRSFRKHHVIKRYFFHLKWEKKFLDSITLQDKDYRRRFKFRKLYIDTVFYSIKAYHKLSNMFRS